MRHNKSRRQRVFEFYFAQRQSVTTADIIHCYIMNATHAMQQSSYDRKYPHQFDFLSHGLGGVVDVGLIWWSAAQTRPSGLSPLPFYTNDHVFVQIVKCICPNSNIYLVIGSAADHLVSLHFHYILIIMFWPNFKWICPNCKMYLSKL